MHTYKSRLAYQMSLYCNSSDMQVHWGFGGVAPKVFSYNKTYDID